MMNIIKNFDTKLGSTMTNEEKDIFQKVEPEATAIYERKLGYYLTAPSPDISKGDTPIECGLAYGYDLKETLLGYYKKKR